MPTFKFSAVVSRQIETDHRQNDIVELSCGHTIVVSISDQRTRYKCPDCYPPISKPDGPSYGYVPKRNAAWDAVRQARGTRALVSGRCKVRY